LRRVRAMEPLRWPSASTLASSPVETIGVAGR
jgi:hypothetical protein